MIENEKRQMDFVRYIRYWNLHNSFIDGLTENNSNVSHKARLSIVNTKKQLAIYPFLCKRIISKENLFDTFLIFSPFFAVHYLQVIEMCRIEKFLMS